MTKECYSKNTYSRFDVKDLILRDELAIERTLLANERTLLAYLRSAVALVIAGFTIMHFSMRDGWFWILGFLCIPGGIMTALFGIARSRKVHAVISRIREQVIEEENKNG